MGKKRGKLDRVKFIYKKGQISLFIIVGLVLLFSASIFFYYKYQVQPPDPIDEEFSPVKTFVDSCLDDISREAIDLIGRNGGYVNFPDYINNNPSSFLPTPLSPNIKNPFWWYDGTTSIPPLEFIKKEIVDHINDNLPTCINDFLTFNQLYNIKEKNNFIASVDIAENDVKISLNYPLTITSIKNNTKEDYSRFFVNIPVRLKKAHELATKITETNIKTKFLEYKGIDLLSLDPNIPTTDFELSCQEKKWPLPQLDSRLRSLIELNFPYIRVKGTEYNENIYVPSPDGEETYQNSYYQNHYIMDIGDISFPNMHVAFIYDSQWPINLVARPSDGRLLKSRPLRGQNIMSFFCIHTWHFTYDFNIPIKVSINDERTDDHDDFTFTYAISASVDHLQPNRKQKATTIFASNDQITEDEFCNDLFYDVEILTFDKITNDPVKDVELNLICGGYYCPLGKTKILSFGAAGGIIKKMPLCSSGFVEINHPTYENKKYPLATDYRDSTHSIFLDPEKIIQDVQVVKHTSIDYSVALLLDEDESATITLSIPDEDFSIFVPYPIDFNFPLKLKAKRDITYDVDIYVQRRDQLTAAYSGKWTVSGDELETAKSAKFHVVQTGFSDEAITNLLTNLDELSKNIPTPELISK